MAEKVFEVQNPILFTGLHNELLEMLKNAYPNLKIVARGLEIKLIGTEEDILLAEAILEQMKHIIQKQGHINEVQLKDLLNNQKTVIFTQKDAKPILFGANGQPILAKTVNQKRMVQASAENDIVFAIGPAGTGKTYTAVAIAVNALKNKQVKRIVLVRPAVEAGESLGFLPGDMKEKVDPYLRPLYDALDDMIHAEKLKSYLENKVIEIVPLAYMRGRTLNNAFIILDEAQNATSAQMKMFLTRLGMDSKIIATGDLTQIDLPKKTLSGLKHAVQLLKDIKGIAFVELDGRDVVRHPLVKKIIEAYEYADSLKDNTGQNLS
ncbi:MAG: PhoH family protein [Bacteroidia bacterium]|nr:PhoH family protein [Bacteroidia bacterium]MDW8347884.1 PhoH family protein [Bacteroidia bacterium]